MWWFTQKIATVKKLTANEAIFGAIEPNARSMSSLDAFGPTSGSRTSKMRSVTMIAMTPSLNASTRMVPGIRRGWDAMASEADAMNLADARY
jgi:hypothetical protein